MTKLKAPAGADEANFGTERFRVDNDGDVDVPEAAVEDLVHTGGFTVVKDDPKPVSAGMIKVSHPDGVGCSFGGVTYDADAKGVVAVPAEAVSALAAHGFKPVEA